MAASSEPATPVAESASGTPEYVDAVVIGSGFGGSVTAYRLAEAGLRLPAGARHGRTRPARSPARPYEMSPRTSGTPSDGLYGLFRRLDLPGPRGARLERARRRLAHLRERAAAQGRRVVRARLPDGGGYENWPIDARATSTRTTTASSACSARSGTRSTVEPYASTPKTAPMHAAARARRRLAARRRSPSRSPTPATASPAGRLPIEPSRTATSTAACATRAACAASATSAATRQQEHARPHLPLGRRAPRAPTCARCTRCARSRRATAAATCRVPSGTSPNARARPPVRRCTVRADRRRARRGHVRLAPTCC